MKLAKARSFPIALPSRRTAGIGAPEQGRVALMYARICSARAGSASAVRAARSWRWKETRDGGAARAWRPHRRRGSAGAVPGLDAVRGDQELGCPRPGRAPPARGEVAHVGRDIGQMCKCGGLLHPRGRLAHLSPCATVAAESSGCSSWLLPRPACTSFIKAPQRPGSSDAARSRLDVRSRTLSRAAGRATPRRAPRRSARAAWSPAPPAPHRRARSASRDTGTRRPRRRRAPRRRRRACTRATPR